mgnify:CR=1 FL=1
MTIKNCLSLSIFKNTLIKLIRPTANPIYNLHVPKGLKFLTRLRVSFSHLREHKFKHNFQDTLNPLCDCSLSIESTEHFFLSCSNFTQHRQILLNSLNNLDIDILDYSIKDLSNLLLFGSPNFNDTKNYQILLSSTNYILSSKRFDENLL